MTTRRVIIERDPGSPLWFIRCAEPCGPSHVFGSCRVCWLGSGFTRDSAAALARSVGYEVLP